MNIRPFWQFYKAILPFAAAFGIIALLLFGVRWGYVLFCTVGVAFGWLGFHNFKRNEYYMYYNLGLTKKKLFIVSFIVNCIVGFPVFLIFLTLFLLFFGKTSIT